VDLLYNKSTTFGRCGFVVDLLRTCCGLVADLLWICCGFAVDCCGFVVQHDQLHEKVSK
jgi:hypothetical protein